MLQPMFLNHIMVKGPELKWLWVDEALAFSSCVMWLVDTMHFVMEVPAGQSEFCENEPDGWDPHHVKPAFLPYLELISKGTLCAALLFKHDILSSSSDLVLNAPHICSRQQ